MLPSPFATEETAVDATTTDKLETEIQSIPATGIRKIFRALSNGIMSGWTILTTVIYTIIFGTIGIVSSLFIRDGKIPFYMGKTWSWFLMKTNRVKIEVQGVEKLLKDKSYVFIANHQSHLDPPAVAVAIPKILRFVAKQSLAKIPFFGGCARAAKLIFIDRGDGKKAVELINKAARELSGGISAFFFAEGTRSRDGRLLPFKKGGVSLALRAGIPIVPVTILGSNKLLPKYGLRIRSGKITIILDDPIDTTDWKEEDRDHLLATIRDQIQTNLLTMQTV